MILTSKPLAALVSVILFGSIFLSSALGWWQTESTKQAAVYTEGEFTGQANPADIRGSYTFGDVKDNFGVEAEVLAQAFGVETDDPAAYSVKSLETLYIGSPEEVGTASVRLFVAFYLNLPIDLSTDMYLPEPAVKILQERDQTAEQVAYLETHTVEETPGSTDVPLSSGEEEAAPVDAEHDETSDTTVKGKTTFADLLDWGVSQGSIELVLGMPLPAAPGMTVRDFCTENGLSFETVKPALQAEVDQLK